MQGVRDSSSLAPTITHRLAFGHTVRFLLYPDFERPLWGGADLGENRAEPVCRLNMEKSPAYRASKGTGDTAKTGAACLWRVKGKRKAPGPQGARGKTEEKPTLIAFGE